MADGVIKISVDTALYHKDAAAAAAYTLTDRMYVELKSGKGALLQIELSPKDGVKLSSAQTKGEFMNELLHQSLRRKISEAHQRIREYIVTQALLSAQPEEELSPKAVEVAKKKGSKALDKELEKEIDRLLAEAEKSDFKKDPLGIAVPWEEKYGKTGVKSGGKK